MNNIENEKLCLVVDGSDIVRKVACHLINDMNITASEVDTGEKALERCRLQMPDAILVDWQTPDTNGIDFISALAAETENLPYIIYCITENDPQDISRALEAGADSYLLKPIDRESIKGKFLEAGLV